MRRLTLTATALLVLLSFDSPPVGIADTSVSCATNVNADPAVRCLDEYGNIRFDDEKARLDNFSVELQNDSSASGYILCYGGRVGRAGEAQRRCERAKNYVVGRRGIEAARIVTVDGGHRESLSVQLCVVPQGVMPPVASPTVDPREVKIIGSKRKPQKKVTSKQ